MPSLSPAGQFSVRRFIHGYPGTLRMPSPDPAGSYTLSRSPEWKPNSHPDVTPDWWAPQLWWNDIAELPVGPSHAGSGVHYLPHRVARPVPPVTPQGWLGVQGPGPVAMGGRKIGGKRSMKWPRLVPRWPNLRGDYGA